MYFKYICSLLTVSCFFACNDNKTNTQQIDPVEVKDSVIAAPTQNSALQDSANFTTIQWIDSMYKDVGEIKNGTKLPLSFKFKNTGNKVLIIDSVWAECGCTVLEIAKKTFEPNTTGDIKAVFDTKNQAVATHEKRIFVKTNTTPHTGSVLTFKAKVIE